MDSYTIIDVPIKECVHTHRQFCVQFKNAYVKHIDPIIDRDIISGYVDIVHNSKKVKIGIDKENQKLGIRNEIYYNIDDRDTKYDEEINDYVFLLHDETGLNYAHFFFDYFGRCLYYDELKKKIPKLKLGILEDFYKEDGNSTFIKQWLELYYSETDLEIIVFKKEKRYKVNNLILSNVFYWFPEGIGHEPILNAIIKTAQKVPAIVTKKNGCYISRQDTIKRGWYHKRELINELDLIEKIKNELDYDIIELMDHSLIEKIQIFKSYKNIVQQSSASNINVFFSTSANNNIIISHPVMENWLNFKCNQFAITSGVNLITLDGGGTCVKTLEETNQTNKDNLPWKLNDIETIIEVLTKLSSEEIWNL